MSLAPFPMTGIILRTNGANCGRYYTVVEAYSVSEMQFVAATDDAEFLPCDAL